MGAGRSLTIRQYICYLNSCYLNCAALAIGLLFYGHGKLRYVQNTHIDPGLAIRLPPIPVLSNHFNTASSAKIRQMS